MKTKKISKICEHCGIEYYDVPKRRLKFCSLKCWKETIINRKTFICKNCGIPYIVNVSRNTTYCSRKCMMIYFHSNEDIKLIRYKNISITKKGIFPQQLHTKQAAINRIIAIKKSGNKPPSPLGRKSSIETRQKLSELHFGEKNQMWKGGVTPINKKIRFSLKYKLWRESVFERDNYTCQICGERGGILHSHHIKQFAYYPELRFEVNNGITLCKKCHDIKHTKV